MDRCAVFVDAGYLYAERRQVHSALLTALRRPARVVSIRAMRGFGSLRPIGPSIAEAGSAQAPVVTLGLSRRRSPDRLQEGRTRVANTC